MAALRVGAARSLALTGAALWAVAAFEPSLAAPSGAPPPTRAEAERMLIESNILARKIELAKGDAFYLILDPSRGTLTLMLKAAILQTYAVRGIEVGSPRVGFVSRRLPETEWEGRIWSRGNLDPPRARERQEIIAPPVRPAGEESNDSKASIIPPTPEEAYPVPHRYHVRFDGGLSLEIRTDVDDDKAKGAWNALAAWWSRRWADARAAFRGTPTDTVRLRLLLRQKDVDSLYRALPPDTKMLVLPPTPR